MKGERPIEKPAESFDLFGEESTEERAFCDFCGCEGCSDDGLGLLMSLSSYIGRFSRFRASVYSVGCSLHCQVRGGGGGGGGRGSFTRKISDKKVWAGEVDCWFVKVICCLIGKNRALEESVDYLRQNLTAAVELEVVRRLGNARFGFRFFEFSRENLMDVHSVKTYHEVIASLCRVGLHDLAKNVFDWMRIDGHLVDDSFLGFFATSVAESGRVDILRQLVGEVGGSEIQLSLYTCNAVLNSLVSRNRVNQAISLFREHWSLQFFPDTCTFNIMIRGLCRLKDIDRAFELLDEMKAYNCSPDIITYNTLLSGLSKVGKVDKGCALLEDLKKRYIIPDVVTYTVLITGYCKLSRMKEASALFHEMSSFGIRPNTVTFNVLIDGFSKIGKIDSATSLLDQMLHIGCHPDVVTFTSLIDGHCRAGQLTIALELWQNMTSRNISPNAYTFSVVINALCKKGRLDEARDFLRRLGWMDIAPQPFIYNPVIDGFCKAGNVDEANTIVSEMEEKGCRPDLATFTILIIGHCMKGRMMDAMSIFHKMVSVGCTPDNITVSTFVSCLLKAGMSREANQVRQAVSGYVNMAHSTKDRDFPVRASRDVVVAV